MYAKDCDLSNRVSFWVSILTTFETSHFLVLAVLSVKPGMYSKPTQYAKSQLFRSVFQILYLHSMYLFNRISKQIKRICSKVGLNFNLQFYLCFFIRYAIFKGCNLKGANLSYCNFERADFSKAVLDGALFLGVRMVCANMESASLQKCTFDDPAGYLANMEGKEKSPVFCYSF